MSNIRIELQLKDGSFTTGILRAGQSIKSFEKELARLDPHFAKVQKSGGNVINTWRHADTQGRTLLSTLRDISIVSGAVSLAFGALTGAAGGIVGHIIRVNAEMERLRYQMMGMSTVADPLAEAARNVAYLREEVTRVPFSLKELSTTFVKLKASGIDPTAGSMRALTDGIAAFGGTDEQLHRVTLGITQMAGKGVIQMEEMRQQLGESMPNAMQIMARSMGVSVSELTAAIATGTVDARQALEGFFEELDRSYGGAAQRMMETFSGQVTKLTANLQVLATGEGLNSFFETQKETLRQINEFLSSDQAKEYAKSIGIALGEMVTALTGAVKILYEFRNELKQIAIAAASALALRSIVGLFRSVAASAVFAAGAIRSMRSGFSEAAAGISLFASSLGGMKNVGTGAVLALTGIRAAAVGLIGTLSAIAPWIALLGGAVVLVAGKFDLFGTKAEEAYQNLRKFGAESREQALSILKDREAILEQNLKDAQFSYDWDFNAPQYKEDKLEKIKKAQEELNDFRESQAGILASAEKRESSDRLRIFEDELEARSEQARAAYLEAQTERDKQYQIELQSAVEQGKSISKIREEYQSDTAENQRKLIQADIDLYDDEISKLSARQKTAKDEQLRILEDMIILLRQKRVEAAKELDGIGDFGIKMNEAPDDIEKLVDKGRKKLEDLRGEIADTKAELRGASGALAKLNIQIANGDYGSIEEGGEVVANLHRQLREAVVQKEALDKLMKGDKAADTALDKIRTDLLEQQMELKEKLAGGDLNDAEKFLLKLDSGYFDGLGPIDNIRESISGVIEAITLQGTTSDQAGKVLRENTFGDQTVLSINTVAEALSGVNRELMNIGRNLAGDAFRQFGLGLDRFGGNFAANTGNGFFELVKSRESGGDYNATLDNGRWTGGPVDLVHMTINEVLALQKQMLADPANRALYGDGKGSSALGAYQIVSQTLKSLVKEMGLTGDEFFSADMQDRMAERLFMRRGANPDALRLEWAGLNGISDEQILAAINSQPGPTRTASPAASLPTMNSVEIEKELARLEQDRIRRTQEFREEAERLSEDLDATAAARKELARKEWLDETIKKTKEASVETEELGKNYADLVAAVEAGDLGASKDINAAEYSQLVKAAKELDEVEKKLKATREASRASDENYKSLEKDRLEIEKKINDERERAKNPDYQADSDELRRLNEQLDEYLANIKAAYGEDSGEYQKALEYRSQMIGQQRALDAETTRADLAKERRDLEESLLSQADMRNVSLQRDLARVDDWIRKAREAGLDEVQIVEESEALKAAIRAKYAAETNPVSQQMKEWGDAQGKLMDMSTQWLDGLAGGMTQLLTGKGVDGLKSALDGMLNDLVGSMFKYVYAQNFGSKTSSIAGKGLGPAAGGKKAAGAGVFHTGGIIGAAKSSRRILAANFNGAPKFHGGGIIGQSLLPSERPVITKVGEGVFTKEQMKALAPVGNGGAAVTLNSPITINGSAGTPEQNQDLADRMAREMRNTVRAEVVSELRQQMRPGNMIGNIRR